jgi:predicted RNase H-like nuclease
VTGHVGVAALLEGSDLDRIGGAVAGVDGCRGGWLVVTAEVSPFTVRSVSVHATPGPTLQELAAGRVRVLAVDMPIGLPGAGPRACDVAARRELGPRRSSVFPAPVRGVLDCVDHRQAVARHRELDGRGLSVQAWNLVPRILQLDRALDDVPAEVRPRVVETHPELAFSVLSGAPMRHPKRTTAGRRERLRALRPHVPDRVTRPAAVPRGAAADDVLDALALAVRAAQWVDGGAPPLVLGDGTVDDRGRTMQIRG